MMTNEEIKELTDPERVALWMDDSRCPYCGNDPSELTADTPDVLESDASVLVTCADCDSEWYEVFVSAGRRDMKGNIMGKGVHEISTN